MDGGSSAPPIGAAGGAAGGGAAGGGGGGLTFPASFAQRQTAPPPIGGGFGRPDESAMVDSLVSQFSEINTAFDPEATLRRFVEVTNLPVEQARGLLTTHGGDLRAAIAAFVASQARSTATSSFEADLDDSDSDDDDSDDEPKIRPVYRTQSGRGIRMRAADRAAALRKLGGVGNSAISKDRRPARPAVARKIPQAVGARFYNDYGETLQLFWDAPGPNPRGAFLQGSILPGATLRMKSYVGHAFHAELAGEMVWGQKLNDKARQWYTIDRSQKQETTQDLFAGWSLTDQPAAAAAAPPIGIGGIGPAADTTGDDML